MLTGLFGIKNIKCPTNVTSSGQCEKRDFDVAHEGPVTCLVRGRQPGTCLSGGHDQRVVLYDYFCGKTIKVWPGHQQRVTKVAYGLTVDMVASGSKDKSIKMWTVDECQDTSTTIEAHDLPITGLDFSPDNKLLCSGSRDNTIKIWDVSSKKIIGSCKIPRNLVTHLVWANPSNILVQTSEDRELRIWDHRIMEMVSSFPKKQHIQTHCDITVDGNYIVTCSNGTEGNGCEATLWDSRKFQLIHEYSGHRQTVNSCLFVRQGDNGPYQVVTVSQDGTARLWNRDTTECVQVWSVDGGGAINDVAHLDDDSLGVATYHSGIHRLLRGIHCSGEGILKKISNF